MRRLLCGLALLLAVAAGARAQDLRTWGYVAWWYPQGWKTVTLSQFERLLLFQFAVRANGHIETPPQWPDTWPELSTQAADAGVPLDATLSLLDPATFDRVFRSPAAAQRLLDEAVALAGTPAIAGLHLDVELYEAPRPEAVEAFRGFVRQLRSRLNQAGGRRELSAFIPLGKFRALYGAQEFPLLDHVVLQGYDAHWDTSPRAGPVAPLDGPYALTWRIALREVDRWNLDRQRVRMGYPLYGYEWNVKGPGPYAATQGKARTTSLMPLTPGAVDEIRDSAAVQILRHGATFDARSASSYYRYQDARGHWHEGWFEDAWSLLRKAQFLREQKVGGIAFFPLGYDGGHLLDMLRPGFNVTPPPH